MGDERFYWVVVATNAHGKLTEAAVCEEDAVAEVQAEMGDRRLLVQKFPATVHGSVVLVTPEMLAVAVQMRDWLWGPPDAPGPGKIVGKQQMLRDAVLELVKLLGGDDVA